MNNHVQALLVCCLDIITIFICGGFLLKRIQTIVFVLFVIFSVPGITQEIKTKTLTLTLPQAVERALANYPASQIQRYAVEQARGERTTVGLFPNPVVTYNREDLSLDGQDIGETTISGGLPLNFLWSRWSRISAASAQVDAEELKLADVQRLIKFKVQKAFAETHFASQNYLAAQKAAMVFRRAEAASRARFADGDMAGYEQQRITVEYLRYQKAETEARVQLNNSQRQLAFLINPNKSEILIVTSATSPTPVRDSVLQNLLEQSAANRPDLQAAQATSRSKQSSLTASKWGRFPEISASAGYKKQNDDFEGAIVEINLGLPLFDRNQGNIRSAKTALNQQILLTELLEKRVALEVRQAYEVYQLYRKQVEQFLDESVRPPEQLLETAQFSYTEGEMSLLELLDGVRAYSDSFQARNDLLLKYELSIFELEKAIGQAIAQY